MRIVEPVPIRRPSDLTFAFYVRRDNFQQKGQLHAPTVRPEPILTSPALPNALLAQAIPLTTLTAQLLALPARQAPNQILTERRASNEK